MKIIFGSDHRGFMAKQRLLKLLPTLGHAVTDAGSFNNESTDYPDYAFKVAQAVGRAEQDRGILVCGSGIGMCIAANKVKGVRAAGVHDAVTAEMSRRHNDANVLCLSSDLLGEDTIERIVKIWLETTFEGGRHARRVDKIKKFEETET
jgi:ribose 5-phosphate isomerase B